ncbi:hypothetical protein P153DRAFT_365252 [Dothidotthia symphoricarpi CBS 119687]|uniref:Glutathione transferase n=1 Tax=Dothidotthia symphoricarpi CBS 119687 TaxID=1392245 RepID=A0A6A6AI88_9PLEO|nr:uncharacterized protein P153DRAFT_365252 [Dothidotthia symphoricarpi CBS 119687]KAF2131682.1 hypothetical protein P153DRAFT_365252 [Dothidotthia symphoricarpi CBS 119687]
MQRSPLHQIHASHQPIPLQDATLFSPRLQHQLQSLKANETIFQQQQQHALSGPPQAPPHALHFQQHDSLAQFPTFPVYFHHAASPQFALTSAYARTGGVQHIQRPSHQTSPPIYSTPQAIPQQPQHIQPPFQSQLRTQTWRSKAPLANHAQFKGLRLVSNPPNLEEWRNKLFTVDGMITLTEDEFQTYFPHIDNVYSHRSTQRHKRKRFVSHYWDCRLKGRPPGTKKSTDPDKKKRKRVARERDLCDVKIKITEFFDREEYEEHMGKRPPGVEEDETTTLHATGAGTDQDTRYLGQSQMGQQQSDPSWDISSNTAQSEMNITPFAPTPTRSLAFLPEKVYTIQRVNGNGGNGKGDGVSGPHKHSLEESDRVKKNCVVRWLAKSEKVVRRVQGGDASKKTYYKKATGNALTTAETHSEENSLKLYGSCFCPFVQRVWISLEYKRIPYQYIEVDPYKKPQSLLDVNPRGLVPGLRHGPTWSTHESTVIMEYLEDLNTGPGLLPPDAQTRATSRLWSDHVNRHIIPMFYKYLQAQDTKDQVSHATELRNQISKLVDAAHADGPFFLGAKMTFVDVQIAPWVLRLRRVLGPYRGWPEPEEGSRWKKWVEALESEESVKMTTSTDELYLDSYERYAENRPGTSQVADAVNSGKGLP